ncbi:MAG: hypothetical protein J1E60_00695 [Christensenellaceae bacterium]|nr:hypothetical protein [Christensenellaceae bacterium]
MIGFNQYIKIENCIFSIERKINNWFLQCAKRVGDKIEQKRRVFYWRNKAIQYIAKLRLTNHISVEQKKEIVTYYSPYFKCNTLFHEFYYASTGKYDKCYITDDIYYTRIDPYFNNWEEALFQDNKTYYGMLFSDVEMPTTVASRSGGLWFD